MSDLSISDAATEAPDDSGRIVVVKPPSDAHPLCIDGGRNPVTKIDLLFMIDNSASMADKQAILAAAVPDLVRRLVDPVCIDPATLAQVGTRKPDGSCTLGIPDFDPVKDIHIGIISSSVGGHGATGVCEDPDPRRTMGHNDDHAHLIARAPNDAPVPTFEDKGFLNWNPAPGSGGAASVADIVTPFQAMVTGVGQHGCGYEAQLESIYRFLIDPDPYETIAPPATSGGSAVVTGTDAALLRQRADFLRPDSLVAVIALTDENDCSIADGTQGFYSIAPPTGFPSNSIIPRGTSACLANPNDKCCFNCSTSSPPDGCPPASADSECLKGPLVLAEDPTNLRCLEQKRRYGIDFLYPVQRYIDGFRNSVIPDRTGKMVRNPLYSDLKCQGGVGCLPERERDLVFFAGVVGVPWQRIAVDSTDLTKGYLTAGELVAKKVWDQILGDPKNASGPIKPADPHMIESVGPRAGLPEPTAAPAADPIHGHEWNPSGYTGQTYNDMQYACTFELPVSKTCLDNSDCDCYFQTPAEAASVRNPICQDPASGTFSTTQRRAKAYPGLRELEVLRGLGEQAIVGSICPANSRDTARADYGYRPVISAIVNRLRNPLRGCVIIN